MYAIRSYYDYFILAVVDDKMQTFLWNFDYTGKGYTSVAPYEDKPSDFFYTPVDDDGNPTGDAPYYHDDTKPPTWEHNDPNILDPDYDFSYDTSSYNFV